MANRRVTDSQPPAPMPSVGAAKMPAGSKPRKRKAVARKAQAVIAATPVPAVTADQRRGMIAYSAYIRAERRGFAPGGEAQDWLAAEREIDALLSHSHILVQ